MSYQPVLHGLLPQIRPLWPSGGSVMYTRAPVRALAWRATSGTPRLLPIGVLPAGRVFWKSGFEKTWLKPPSEAIQPISRTPGFAWQFTGGSALSTPVPVFGLVQRY